MSREWMAEGRDGWMEKQMKGVMDRRRNRGSVDGVRSE